MSNRKQIALELFYMARREAQIIKALHRAYGHHSELFGNMADTMLTFSPWKVEDILAQRNPYYNENLPALGQNAPLRLWRITEANFVTPQPEHMLPKFSYSTNRIAGKSIDGSLTVSDEYRHIKSDEVNEFWLATKADVALVEPLLPILKPKKGKATR
jgi:hypothetical protein